jgi:hypothetical protein
MNTSILMALVVILGFAHLPSQKSFPLAHGGPGSPGASDVLAELRSGVTERPAKSRVAAYCSIPLRDQSLNHISAMTALSCCDYFTKEYRAAAGVPTLIDDMEPQAAPSSRPTLIHCTERVAINSLEH